MCNPFRMREYASCPASLLWGCNSGALRVQGVHDALGTVLYYLYAGAPFVLGCLWIVTDVDIDSLSMTVMEKIFSTPCGISLALAESRDGCKLKYGNGSAPIIFGIPLPLQHG